MGYIIKDNQGLLVTRLTDLGRRKISEGNFKISYFQIGDSEVSYTAVDNYTQQNSYVLEPPFNAQNNVGVPQSTKNDIKYPFYLGDAGSTTYGLPFMASADDEVYNSATVLGFFSSCTSNFFPLMDTGHCYSSNRIVSLPSLTNGNSQMTSSISTTGTLNPATSNPSAGTFVTLFSQSPATAGCNFQSCKPTYRFKVTSFGANVVTVDRTIPDLVDLGFTGNGRLIFIPSGMTGYDTPTPLNYWSSGVTNFESICTPDDGYVQIWNMNIPWSENPAGLTFPQLGYNDFGSVNYNGTKEYLGYSTSGGQVFYDSTLSQTASTDTWFYNINLDKVFVEPQDQKAIAIVHYTNNSIINYYGEKFATNVYGDTTGDARHLVIDIPWVMWHKNTNCCNGLKLYIDPPGFNNLTEDLLTPNYIQSTKNLDMNSPGMRYYHLWDTNPNSKDGGKPNRVGKVFPDDKMIVFDDDELVAIFNGKSNRSFTLPAPIVRGKESVNGTGLLSNEDDCVWVTYGFGSSIDGYQYLHCNYYQKVTGPKSGCTDSELDIILSFSGQNFANELKCLNDDDTIPTGYTANEFFVLIQKGSTSQSRPTPGNWVKVDLTTEIITPPDYISSNDLVNATTLLVDLTTYESSLLYDLSTQIGGLPTQATSASARYTFGDDYSFFGNIKTDITATIYEMRYLINLPYNQFLKSSNPTWSEGIIPYITEIGLYDENKNLLVLGKVQSPTIRQGSQQWNLKLDF